MKEYEALEDLDAIAQGDIFEWVGGERKRPWRVYGVVVTADCDLHREKHGGVISYVPAVLTEDFMWERWRVARFGKLLDDSLATCARRVSKWLRDNSAGGEISISALRQWLERKKAAGILDELGVESPSDRTALLNVLSPAEVFETLMRSEEPDIGLMRKAYAIYKPASLENSTLLAADVQNSWNSLPGDIFHVPSMPEEEAPDGYGLFLQLRHIRQVRAEALSARPDELRAGGATCRRVARISAPYRYAMTQALGRVFTDIGLPEAHERRRKSAADLFLKGQQTA